MEKEDLFVAMKKESLELNLWNGRDGPWTDAGAKMTTLLPELANPGLFWTSSKRH
jgi:hypothetical protein